MLIIAEEASTNWALLRWIFYGSWVALIAAAIALGIRRNRHRAAQQRAELERQTQQHTVRWRDPVSGVPATAGLPNSRDPGPADTE
ncbi:hypothetical protein [Longispora albida]|uniref:hypothetical protein n=1 Tax=Longispora albida TaxID=203523 RepID=UPI0003633BDE|nr:hypothetical protein [Longispora albida]